MENYSPLDVVDFGHSAISVERNVSQQVNLNMMLQLQTTLDLERQLEIYAKEARKYIKFEGLTLLFDDQSFRLNDSAKGKIETSFNLNVDGVKLANLVYSTNYTLNSRIENKLTSLHQQLKFSLRNAIEYNRLKRMTMKDHLTGLGNRGYFDEMFQRQCSNAQRNEQQMTLLLLDLDNFKQVNDCCGHTQGDKILAAFAEVISASIRDTDFAFRFGGDEFAVLLPNTANDVAKFVATRLTHNVAGSVLLTKHKVTCSIGVASWKSSDSKESLFDRADQALYQAKNSGRNCFKSA